MCGRFLFYDCVCILVLRNGDSGFAKLFGEGVREGSLLKNNVQHLGTD